MPHSSSLPKNRIESSDRISRCILFIIIYYTLVKRMKSNSMSNYRMGKSMPKTCTKTECMPCTLQCRKKSSSSFFTFPLCFRSLPSPVGGFCFVDIVYSFDIVTTSAFLYVLRLMNLNWSTGPTELFICTIRNGKAVSW